MPRPYQRLYRQWREQLLRYGGGSIIRINIVSVSGAEQNAFEIRRKLFFLEFDMQTVMFGDGGFRQFRESAFLGWRLTNSASLQSLRIWSCSSSFSSSPEREAVAGRRTGKVFSAVSSVLRNVGFFSAVSATGSAKLSAISSGRQDSLQAV